MAESTSLAANKKAHAVEERGSQVGSNGLPKPRIFSGGWTALPGAFWLGSLVFVELLLARVLSMGRYAALLHGNNTDTLFALHSVSKGLAALFVVAFAAATFRGYIGRPLVDQPWARRGVLLFNLVAFLCLLVLLPTLPLADYRNEALSDDLRMRFALAIAAFSGVALSGLVLVYPRGVGVVTPLVLALMTLVPFGIYEGFLKPIVDLSRGVIEGAALDLSLWFYSLSGRPMPELTLSGANPIMASGDFVISIGAPCSGYQGMMSAFVLLGGYITLERRSLHLTRAILLSVVAIGTTFTLNAFRIAVLFYIGEEVSQEVAVNGFHNQFGTLSLLAVTALTIAAMETRYFRRAHGTAADSAPSDVSEEMGDIAILMMPLAIYLLVGMIAGLFVGVFNWLYPIPVLIGAGALWVLRKQFTPALAVPPGVASIGVGAAVFGLWLALIAPDPERAALLQDTLSAAPVWMAGLWIAFRVFGSSVIVPVTEELAFRGGILRLIELVLPLGTGSGLRAGLALLGSSVAFGLLHADIAAGTLAGLAYGGLYLWRRSLMDAIVAHAVTNFLICLYVLGFGGWSYW